MCTTTSCDAADAACKSRDTASCRQSRTTARNETDEGRRRCTAAAGCDARSVDDNQLTWLSCCNRPTSCASLTSYRANTVPSGDQVGPTNNNYSVTRPTDTDATALTTRHDKRRANGRHTSLPFHLHDFQDKQHAAPALTVVTCRLQ